MGRAGGLSAALTFLLAYPSPTSDPISHFGQLLQSLWEVRCPGEQAPVSPGMQAMGGGKDERKDTPHRASQLACSAQCKVFGIGVPS